MNVLEKITEKFKNTEHGTKQTHPEYERIWTSIINTSLSKIKLEIKEGTIIKVIIRISTSKLQNIHREQIFENPIGKNAIFKLNIAKV